MTTPDYEALGRYTAALDAYREALSDRHNHAANISRAVQRALIGCGDRDGFRPVDTSELQAAVLALIEAEARAAEQVDTINALSGKVGKRSIFVSNLP